MFNTPTKFSTPSTKNQYSKYHQYTPSSCQSIKSTEQDSILKMINREHLSGGLKRKGSLFLQRSISNTSDDCVLEDRFIPSRRLIHQFGISDDKVQDQNQINQDPQLMTVAQIYQQQILGKNTKKQDGYKQNDIQSFQNKNILKFRFNVNLVNVPKRKIYNSFNDLSPLYTKTRKINKQPCKILDAPALVDDFYLNLVAWSNQNLLAVGLGNSIYLWNGDSSKVTRLCELPNDNVTSVGWDQTENRIAIGCDRGSVLIWDVAQQKQSRKMEGHQVRVGSIAWGRNFLSTGSKDKTILQRDLRSKQNYAQKLAEHGQQICGLKWSKDDQYLASGGNDNKAIVWNLNGHAVNKYCDHKAAVKAIAWSPHHHGLLATGGGTADRTLKMRNIFTGQIICSQDTGSQICNLQFSKTTHQVVSTHGYSQNQINVWSYPTMKKIATLKGHTHRVLYLAVSPDGSTIVTGAGDQTLRFWKIFPSVKAGSKNLQSQLQSGPSFR